MMNKITLCRGRLAQWLSVRFVKICSPGDRNSNLAEDYFSDANLFAQMFGGKSNYRTSYIVSRNLSIKWLLRQSLLSEEDVALKNWFYDVTA